MWTNTPNSPSFSIVQRGMMVALSTVGERDEKDNFYIKDLFYVGHDWWSSSSRDLC